MFEQFTERARQAVVLAQEEARALEHNYIGTEHMLLGLLREREGVAARVLGSLDITVERVRSHVIRLAGPSEELIPRQIPFTPRAKRLLELALREAATLGHDHVGTEHMLLGVVRGNEGVAARVLRDCGADPDTIRDQVTRMLTGASTAAPGPATAHEKLPQATGMSVDELDKALDEAIDQLRLEEQAFSSRRRMLHDNIAGLRAERDRRRLGDA